jgi:hypothetical protein
MDLKVLGKLAQALDWSPRNDNSRFIPHELPGGKWGIWDMQTGTSEGSPFGPLENSQQARNWAQWLNHTGGHSF